MDILILAILAVFIFYKLKSQLGEVDKTNIDKKKLNTVATQENQDNTQINSEESKKYVNYKQIEDIRVANIDLEVLKFLDEVQKKELDLILEKSQMKLDFFIDASKKSFEIVIDAFSNAKIESLKELLSERLYNSFVENIEKREQENHKLISNLISFDEVYIKDCQYNNDEGSIIKVQFLTKQINYVTDKDNQIINGDRNLISQIEDNWTFKKFGSGNSNKWLVVSTI